MRTTSLLCIAVILQCALAADAAEPRRRPATTRATTTTTTTAPTSGPSTQPTSRGAAPLRERLPAAVDATAVGGGGRYLILHLKKLQVLGVFDVATGKVRKYLPMPTNELAFTAGAEKLFV